MQRSSKIRARHVLGMIGAAALLGGAYALVCSLLGFGIPCPFYTLTGWKCPGCGVSRMCLCLLRLDFSGAWRANPVLLALLPVGGVLAVRMAVRYVRSGDRRLVGAENGVVWCMCAILLVFGVVRNFIGS